VASRARDRAATVVFWIATAGAVLSASLLIGFHRLGMSDTRLYEGTDTRAAALLLGVALAAWRARPEADDGVARLGGWIARFFLGQATGVVAAILLGILWFRLDGQSPWVYRGGLALASLLAVLVIAAARSPQWIIGRVFALAPLRWLGAISYGLYLWHWPIYQAIDARNGRLPGLGDRVLTGPGLLALKVGASLVVAVISFKLVEHPIRRGALPSRLAPTLAVAGAAVAALVVVLGTRGAVSPDTVKITDQADEAAVKVVGAPKVFVAGDSVALSVASRLYADPERYGVNPFDRTRIGCTIAYVGHDVKNFVGNPIEPPACADYAFEGIDEERPEVFFLDLGSRPNDAMEIDGRWSRACDDAYDETYRTATIRFLRKVRATGAQVAIATIVHSGENTLQVTDSERRIDCVNAIIRSLPDAVDGVHLVDIDRHLCPDGAGSCVEELDGDPIRTDGLHFDRGPGGDRVVDWIMDEVFAKTKVPRPEPGPTRPKD
jgi:hypothetical protein